MLKIIDHHHQHILLHHHINGKKEDKDSNEKDAKNIYVKKFFDLLKDVKPQVLDTINN